MSKLASRVSAANENLGIFGVVASERLGGKSTLAGTLPGKTLMLQAAVLETGSKSAKALAKKLGNQLDIVDFIDLEDLVGLIKDFETSDYDNLYIDGISAVTEMKYYTDEVQRAMKKDNWGAFRMIGDSVRAFIKLAKAAATDHGKRVFITLALAPKRDANGNLTELVPQCKGNVAISEISRLCPIFVTLRTRYNEEGELMREMVTKSDDVYPGRLDTLLDGDNPGVMEADLSKLLALVEVV